MIHSRKVTAYYDQRPQRAREGQELSGVLRQAALSHILATLDKTYAVDEILVDTTVPRYSGGAKLSAKCASSSGRRNCAGSREHETGSLNTILRSPRGSVPADARDNRCSARKRSRWR